MAVTHDVTNGARRGDAAPVQPPGPATTDAARTAQEHSVGQLLSKVSRDFGDLVSTQIELAKAELKEDVAKAGRGAGMLGGGAVAALMALVLLSFAAAWGLAEVLEPGLAFLLVGLVHAAVAAVLFLRGKAQLDKVTPIAPATAEELKEDVEWARQLRS